jgi:hypothetical protein
MAGILVMKSNVHFRESYESAIQISMLTNELSDLPSIYAEKMINTITSRNSSYYGYVVVPDRILEKKVYDLLQYQNDKDKQYATLLKQFDLDFAWFDTQGRHIMVWGNSTEKVEYAIKTIKDWLCLIITNYY